MYAVDSEENLTEKIVEATGRESTPAVIDSSNFVNRRPKIYLREIFSRAIAHLNQNERDGLMLPVRLVLKHRFLASLVVICGLAAAVFEGSTIGILGLAVTILLEQDSRSLSSAIGSLGAYVEHFIPPISKGGLFLLLVGVAVTMQIVKSVLLYGSQVSQVYLATTMRRAIQRQVTNHIMSLTYPAISRYPVGEVAGYIEQAQGVQDFVDMLSNVARASFMLFVYFGIMIWTSPSMSLIAAFVALVFLIALNRVVAKIKVLSKKATTAKLFLLRWSIEYLNAPRLLRIFDGTKYAGEKINKARDNELYPERQSVAIEAAIKPTMEVISTVGAGALLVGGYLFAGDSAIEMIPTLFVFVVIFQRMKTQVQAFSDLRTKMAKVLPKLEVVARFLTETTHEVTTSSGFGFEGLKKQVSFKNVNFRYPGSSTDVLRNIDFSLDFGQTVALVGPSGAGKSTIADLLVGLYQPTVGSITVDDQDLSSLDMEQWRANIGVVDQDVFLLNTSIRENIRFARPLASDADIERATKMANAYEFIKEFENGYETEIGNRGYRLSGGQQQRLSLARALLRNPQILILDEATSALDSESEYLIKKAIDEMHHSRTILIIAHRLSTVATADKILVIEKGRVSEQGTKDSLLEKAGKFASLWELQTKG